MHLCVRLPTSNRVASPEAIVSTARLAEELGYWAVSAHDHLVFDGAWVACGSPGAQGDGDDRDMYELLATLSFVAGSTSRIRLLTGILLLPVRETILAAKQVATLDALSEGRMLVGVGVGASPPGARDASTHVKLGGHAANAQREYEALGVPRRRGALADEQIDAMHSIWQDAKASHHGAFVRFDDIDVFPKPHGPGGPPVLIGGSSHLARRRAIRHGDGWLPNSISPRALAEGVVQLHTAERPLEHIGVNLFTVVGETDEAAAELARHALGARFDPEHLAEQNLVGNIETVREKLMAYEAAGATFVDMKPVYRDIGELHRTMRALADAMCPAAGASR